MGSLVTIGLKAIEFADIGADGTPGTTFTKKFNTSTDSFSFAEADPNVKEVNVEESQYPLKRFKSRGALVINASVADPDSDLYAYLRGGTVTTATGKKTYKDGDTVSVEKTVRITPSEGLAFTINRCDISALISGGLGKNQELFLALTLTALQPVPAGTAAVEVVETVPTT